jgi:glycosyltransferase involved in cell wall biosynthesis
MRIHLFSNGVATGSSRFTRTVALKADVVACRLYPLASGVAGVIAKQRHMLRGYLVLILASPKTPKEVRRLGSDAIYEQIALQLKHCTTVGRGQYMSEMSKTTIILDCLGVRIGKQRGAERYICGIVTELASLESADFLLLVNKTWLDFVKDLLPPERYMVVPIWSDNRVFRMLIQMMVGPIIAGRRRAAVYVSTAVFPMIGFPCPTVAFMHDVMLFHFPKEYPRASWLIRTAILKMSVATLTAIFTSSKASAQDIRASFKNRVRSTYVIPGGAPASIAPPSSHERERAILNELGLTDKKFVLSVLGAGEYKNPRGLAEAANKLRDWGRDDIEMIVVGDSIRTLASINYSSPLRPLGFVSDEVLAVLYANAGALVFPTLFEGFGLPVIDAHAAGLPVICSGIDVLREVGGSGAVFIDPHSAESIARAIVEVVDTPEKRRALIQAGKENAARFTWRRAIERFIASCGDVSSKTKIQQSVPTSA